MMEEAPCFSDTLERLWCEKTLVTGIVGYNRMLGDEKFEFQFYDSVEKLIFY